MKLSDEVDFMSRRHILNTLFNLFHIEGDPKMA
jgi:hypothetical protein